MNKGDNVLKDISKTDKDKPIELPNLEPASTYSVKTSVVLPPEFGGRGDPEVTDVYTGKFKLRLQLPLLDSLMFLQLWYMQISDH